MVANRLSAKEEARRHSLETAMARRQKRRRKTSPRLMTRTQRVRKTLSTKDTAPTMPRLSRRRHNGAREAFDSYQKKKQHYHHVTARMSHLLRSISACSHLVLKRRKATRIFLAAAGIARDGVGGAGNAG